MNENTYTDVVRHIPTGHTEANNVSCKINGESACVPIDPANRHYAEILRQVADGDLTIADAE